jgi:hypothetical protein
MNSQQCLTMMEAVKSGCQSDAEFWAAVAELQQSAPERVVSAGSSVAEGAGPVAVVKRRGPTPLAERTPEQQAAHAAAKAARAAAKAGSEAASAASSDAEGPKKAKKAKKVAAEGGGGAEAAPKEKKPPSPWNLLVTKTVSDMRQSGWKSWTDSKGVVWPSSKLASVKGAELYVYDGGDHDGKPPSPALGGMVRASWLKTHVAGIQLPGEWAEE